MTAPRRNGTLYAKFALTVLGTTGLGGVATLVMVVLMSVSSSRANVRDIQQHIRSGIESKGRVLTKNHALALTNMVNDNALVDIQRLVAQAVAEDKEVVYGLYVAQEGKAWAYTAPDSSPEPQGLARSPKPNAWRALGLRQNDLMVPRLGERTTILFGQEILEISAPVVDGSEHLGTLRYGLSTKRMREALATAQARSEQSLKRTVQLLIGLVAGVTFLGILVSRRLTARITRPLGVLNEAAKALASGNREIRVAIHSGDELERLGDSFNNMVLELTQSYEALEELNRSLEERVRERTAELAERNRGMRMVLDNVQEGLITLSIAGTVSHERSAVVDKWFGACIGELPLWRCLGDFAADFALELELAWESIVEDVLPLALAVEQLPRRLKARGRSFEVGYSPLLKNEHLEGMLVVIEDVTERLAREREEAEQREFIIALQRLMRDRSGFMSFFHETTRLLRDIPDETNRVVQMRRIHTIKGNAGLHGLNSVAELCHRLESHLKETGQVPSPLDFAPLQERWQALSDVIGARTAETRSDWVQVPRAEYDQVLGVLERAAANTEALRFAQRWPLEPVSLPFERLGELAVALSARLGKGQLVVEQDPGDVRVDSEAWAPFWSDMSHVIRNAIDHGLEAPEERQRQGKGLPALRLKARDTPTATIIEVTDDGRGVNWELVRTKAKALHIPHATQHDLSEALYADRLSTREQADGTSGRGIGLAAVHARVQKMGGAIELTTAPSKGTTWRFRFPRSLAAHPAYSQATTPG